jgi:tRNA nucleotidyltransferase/poly(A) polymerase
MGFRFEPCGKRLVENGFWAYYVYDTTRDMLMGRAPGAIDILTDADLFQIAKLFPNVVFRKHCDEHVHIRADRPINFFVSEYPEDKRTHIPGLIENKREARIHASRNTLFSINSFVYDFEREIFYDPLDAYGLLKQEQIKTVEKPENSAKKFPTLALRTAKLFSQTGFSIDKKLTSFLKKNRSLYDFRRVNECMADDFKAILVSGRAYESFLYLDEWGIIDQLLPEIAALKGVYQDKDHHPEGNGFWHTLQCMRFVKRPTRPLMMAILLHDTGKAVTQVGNRRGAPFPKHSIASKRIAQKAVKRFYFTDDEIDEILFLVENHMILNSIDRLPEHQLRSLFTSSHFSALLALYRADLESGYHSVDRYYHAARVFHEFVRKERLRTEGVYI